MINPQQLYPLAEAQALSGLSSSHLRRMLNQGLLQGEKIPWGKRDKWLIPGASLIGLKSGKDDHGYEAHYSRWIHEQVAGFGGKPLSPRSIQANEYGLGKFWAGANLPPSTRHITAATLALALASVPIIYEGSSKTCHYSQRDQMYKAALSFAKYLLRHGLLSTQEITAMRALKPRRVFPARKTVTDREGLDALLLANHARAQSEVARLMNHAMLHLLGTLGLRRNEVIHALLEHLDLTRGVLWIFDGKGHKNRVVPLSSEAEQALVAWLAVRPESDHKNLVVQAHGAPLTESVVNNRIQRLAKEAGIDITPHGLRRTCATLDLNQHGLSVDMVRLKLGHTDIKTTQGYLMTDEQALIDFVRGKIQPPTPIEPQRDFILA